MEKISEAFILMPPRGQEVADMRETVTIYLFNQKVQADWGVPPRAKDRWQPPDPGRDKDSSPEDTLVCASCLWSCDGTLLLQEVPQCMVL